MAKKKKTKEKKEKKTKEQKSEKAKTKTPSIKTKVEKLPKSTYEIEITVPWERVEEIYDRIFDKAAEEIEIAGFRKGKAPKKLVEEKIDKNKLKEEVLKEIIPQVYAQAVKENNLKPITTPDIRLVSSEENKDWVIKATIANKPKVSLKNYKQKIKAVKKSKKKKIWRPGDPKDEKSKEKEKPSLGEIVNAIYEEVEVEFPPLLLSRETDRLIASLVDQVQQMGLTMDKYAMAKATTREQLRKDKEEQAEKNLKIEFALSEIADRENITVSQNDIEEILSKVEDEKEKEKLKSNTYYLAYLVRQQKTLDFLNNL